MGKSLHFPDFVPIDAEPHTPAVRTLVSIFCILMLAVVLSFLYLMNREQGKTKVTRASAAEWLEE